MGVRTGLRIRNRRARRYRRPRPSVRKRSGANTTGIVSTSSILSTRSLSRSKRVATGIGRHIGKAFFVRDVIAQKYPRVDTAMPYLFSGGLLILGIGGIGDSPEVGLAFAAMIPKGPRQISLDLQKKDYSEKRTDFLSRARKNFESGDFKLAFAQALVLGTITTRDSEIDLRDQAFDLAIKCTKRMLLESQSPMQAVRMLKALGRHLSISNEPDKIVDLSNVLIDAAEALLQQDQAAQALGLLKKLADRLSARKIESITPKLYNTLARSYYHQARIWIQNALIPIIEGSLETTAIGVFEEIMQNAIGAVQAEVSFLESLSESHDGLQWAKEHRSAIITLAEKIPAAKRSLKIQDALPADDYLFTASMFTSLTLSGSATHLFEAAKALKIINLPGEASHFASLAISYANQAKSVAEGELRSSGHMPENSRRPTPEYRTRVSPIIGLITDINRHFPGLR